MELIDRADLMGKLTSAEMQQELRGMTGAEVYARCLEMVNSAPNGVVRCAECKKCSHDTLFGTRWCNGHEVKPDDFCSMGERSEGE